MEPEYRVEARERNQCHVPMKPTSKGMESIMEIFEAVVTSISCIGERCIILLHRENGVGSHPKSVTVKKL